MAVYSGHLVLVVGPSGAGKDSILREAAGVLANCSRYVFPRRIVTRQAAMSAEDHDSILPDEFLTSAAAGAFALHWSAHGNSYGIPGSVLADLARGRTVIVNCSRAILAEAAGRFPYMLIVEITAPQETLISRIVARGRETADEATARVSRQVPPMPLGVRAVQIVNDGPLAAAVAQFMDLIAGLEDTAPHPGGGPLNHEHEDEDGDDDRRRLVVVE